MISEVTCVKNGWLVCASEIDQEEYCVRISDIDSIHYSLIDGRSRVRLTNDTEVHCDGNVIDLLIDIESQKPVGYIYGHQAKQGELND